MTNLEVPDPRNIARTPRFVSAFIGKPAGLRLALRISWLAAAFTLTRMTQAAAVSPQTTGVLLEKEGKVELARKGTATWTGAQVNDVLQPGDRLRTGARSRAALRWAELSVVRVNELTSMEIRP